VDYILRKQQCLRLEDIFIPWKRIYRLADKHFVDIFKRYDWSHSLNISVPFGLSKSASFMPQGLLKAITGHCPDLEELYAYNVVFEIKSARPFFAAFPCNLLSLYLRNSNVTKPLLNTILTNCKSLVRLDLSCTQIAAECLKGQPITAITYLNIANCSKLQLHLDSSRIGQILADVHQMCPQLKELNMSLQYTELYETWFSFESVFCQDVQVEAADHVKSTLTSLTHLTMCTTLWCDEDLANRPLNARMPNLKNLDLEFSELDNFRFLLRLPQYCPKLRSLNLSCSTAADFYHNADQCSLAFSSLNGLNVLRFNAVKHYDPLETVDLIIKVIGVTELNNCVQSISSHLKQLKILEMCGYPDLSNEHIVELINNLTELKELHVEDCPGINDELFIDREFTTRRQRLDIKVFGTSVSQEVSVPDMIKLNFTDRFNRS